MSFISDILDKLQQENIDNRQQQVSDLYTGWGVLTSPCTDTKEVLKVLNAALSVSEVIKEHHTSPATFYNQFVVNSTDVVAVYYCKRSNTIKAV